MDHSDSTSGVFYGAARVVDGVLANQDEDNHVGPDPWYPQPTYTDTEDDEPYPTDTTALSLTLKEHIQQQQLQFSLNFEPAATPSFALQDAPDEELFPTPDQPAAEPQPSQAQAGPVEQGAPTATSSVKAVISKLPCPECDGQYATLASLRKHRKRMHSSRPNTITCGIDGCNKPYADDKGVKRHRDRDHPSDGTPPEYKCPTCNKSFSRRDNLARHRKVERH